MATVTIPSDDRTLTDASEISEFLSQYGIWYRRFEGDDDLSEDASEAEILAAYSEPIERLKTEGGYVTADVINVTPDVPNLDAMLAKFEREHTHSENEVRFIVKGSGLFHINPADAPTFRIEVVKGDMINVPSGTKHWFHLCSDRTIRAIRLFEDQSGWTPHYTESGAEQDFQPLCFGPAYIDADQQMTDRLI
jgi:1,2-dihydroxy-3-keto-5-methylthiopentene dioxygenase